MAVLSVVSTFNDRGIRAANREVTKLQAVAKKAGDTTAASMFNASRKMNDFAGSTGKMGSSLTQNLSLPLAAVGTASFIVGSQYESTMNQIQAASGASATEMKSLGKMANTMGTDIGFGARESAAAILELSKSGMSPAAIEAGGLEAALMLAAAGGVSLESAATTASNAVNMFGLKAKDAGSVSNALAGGANASSASVESLQQALSQVGPGAKNAGLSLQDTVGTLAAFADKGIQGSDAGTSLKTMLQRLSPQTEEAAKAMDKYGLSFVDSKGNFDSVTTVAQKLKDKLGGLTEEQRASALQTMFGSDATRAATVMMDLGSAGVGKYIAATKDQTAASKMAAAATKGNAGELKKAKAELENAGVAASKSFAPAIGNVAKEVGGLSGKFAALSPKQQDMIVKAAIGAAALGPLLSITSKFAGVGAGAAKGIGSLSIAMGKNASSAPAWAQTIVNGTRGAAGFVKQVALGTAAMAKQAALWVADTAKKVANAAATAAHTAVQIAANVATKAWAAGQWLLNAALTANPIGIVIALIVALVAGIVVLWRKNEGFRNALIGAWNGIKNAAVSVWQWLVAAFKKWGLLILASLVGPIGLLVYAIAKNWDKIKAGAIKAWTSIKTVVTSLWNGLMNTFKNGLKFWAGIGKSIVDGLKNGIQGAWRGLISKFSGLVGLLPAAVKKILGIHSPSRVFAGLGANIGQGLAQGITGTQRMVQNATIGLVSMANGNMGGSMSGSLAFGSAGGGSRSLTVMPGAIQVVLPEGSPAQTQRAAGEGVLAALAREWNRS